MKGWLIFFLFMILISLSGQLNAGSFQEIFATEWADAENYVSENKFMGDSMQKYGISPILGWSIVFPELLRYNSLKNYLEVTALQTLYIQFGNSYANFSVGWFQMKPSFAMSLQKSWMQNQKNYFGFPVLSFDTTDTPEARRSVVSLLNSDAGQLLYLMMFVKIMDFKAWSFENKDEKLKIYATAYNSSFHYNKETLQKLSVQKHFHTGLTSESSDTKYSYAAIALEYFQSN